MYLRLRMYEPIHQELIRCKSPEKGIPFKLTCLANRLLTVRMHGIKIGIIAVLAMIPFRFGNTFQSANHPYRFFPRQLIQRCCLDCNRLDEIREFTLCVIFPFLID